MMVARVEQDVDHWLCSSDAWISESSAWVRFHLAASIDRSMESRKGRIRSALSFLGFMDVLLDRTMTQPGVRAISGVPKSGTPMRDPTSRTPVWSENAPAAPTTPILRKEAVFFD